VSRETREGALLLAPAALLLGAVVALPIARVLQLALPGIEPVQRLSQDGRWWGALGNTLFFAGASVTIEVALGVLIALALHRAAPGRGLLRAIVILPWALPTAVMALAWAWIFNDAFGVANDLLMRLQLIEAPVAWLARPGTAMATLIVADVWKTTPFVALIALAGLVAIPEELNEAARVDGLSPVQIFRRITLPLLAPALVVAAVFRLVQAFGAFDLVYVMTGGGPGGSTETVSLYAYQNYFRYLDFGYGSTLAVAGALVVAGIAWGITRLAPSDGEAR
jgi:multiple sugar transport system permease protein